MLTLTLCRRRLQWSATPRSPTSGRKWHASCPARLRNSVWIATDTSTSTATYSVLTAVCVLQTAFAVECNPSQPNFWAQVARKVPGKTAQECLDRHFGTHPTPPVAKPKKLPKYLQAQRPAPAFAGEQVRGLSAFQVSSAGQV